MDMDFPVEKPVKCYAQVFRQTKDDQNKRDGGWGVTVCWSSDLFLREFVLIEKGVDLID